MENKIKTIVISSKDRFIRFGFEWFEKFCEKFNTTIMIVNNETLSPNEELVRIFYQSYMYSAVDYMD